MARRFGILKWTGREGGITGACADHGSRLRRKVVLTTCCVIAGIVTVNEFPPRAVLAPRAWRLLPRRIRNGPLARHGNGLRPSRKQPCLQTSKVLAPYFRTYIGFHSVQAQCAVFVSLRSGASVFFVGGDDAGHCWAMDVACRACMAMRRTRPAGRQLRSVATKVSVFRAERRKAAQKPRPFL